ncbi:hypothetical protein ONZ45_g8991 [Pleurotus djamor]|nr:hypothetical protein ONZ45_g8991 [Pleurotus djamor]
MVLMSLTATITGGIDELSTMLTLLMEITMDGTADAVLPLITYNNGWHGVENKRALDEVDGDNNGWHGAENRRRGTAVDSVELDNNGWHGSENQPQGVDAFNTGWTIEKRATTSETVAREVDAVDGDNNGWHGAENRRRAEADVDVVDTDNNGWHCAIQADDSDSVDSDNNGWSC